MGQKEFRSISSTLAGSGLTDRLPSQHVDPPARAKPETPPQADAAAEPEVQFSFSLRKRLRKELKRLADDADMPVRSFILNALKEKGLSVTDDDLIDRRKKPGEEAL